MISRGCSIAADLLVAGVTWWNAYKEHKVQKGLKLQNSMRDVILYDGEHSEWIPSTSADAVFR